jgi:isopenicillin-N epimerase
MLAGDEPHDLLAKWHLDPAVAHLNHGSFGACPREVLSVEREIEERIERNAMQFFVRDLEPLLDDARAALGRFVGADPDDLAFVTNASTAVNAVLRSLDLAPGDELLVTDHAYNACRNALDFVADRVGARVVVAAVPFPIQGPEAVTSAILDVVTPRTRLALVDHVTSPTALVFPIADIVRALGERGVETLVDGAHAPGMLPLDLDRLGAAYYTGNCHKWLCAPKGCAFLHVRRDRQAGVRPLVISHGANAERPLRSRFRLEFDWVGTENPAPYLSLPAALGFLEALWPGGHAALVERNRALALRTRDALVGLLGGSALAPASMIGSIASVRIPDGPASPRSALDGEPLQEALARSHKIEVPVFSWGAGPGRVRLLRTSSHAYNRWADVQRLSAALREELRLPA